MVDRKLIIGHLYPKQMNVYGDMGNILSIRYRLTERGIGYEYVELNSLSQIKDKKIDILIGGGGQDSNQEVIQNDLHASVSELKAQCADGLVSLMVCGMYQLFGKTFILKDKSALKGVGIFNLETHAGDDRLIGNIITDSQYGRLIGFENHSGRTYLGSDIRPLGRVVSGAGNNNEDKSEGAEVYNTFGTYMHGPVLVKNPQLCDELIRRALDRKYSNTDNVLVAIDDSIETKTRQIAMKRPR